MERPVRLALVVRAIALKKAGRLLHDSAAEEFPSDPTDVHLGNPPVIVLYVVQVLFRHSNSTPWAI